MSRVIVDAVRRCARPIAAPRAPTTSVWNSSATRCSIWWSREHLYRAFPERTEGDLSRLRARVVSSEPLAEVAATLGLGDELQLGSGELKTGGFRRQSILADALEARVRRGVPRRRARGGASASSSSCSSRASPRCRRRIRSRMRKRACRSICSRAAIAAAIYASSGSRASRTRRFSGDLRGRRPRAAQPQGSGSSRRRAEQEAAESMLLKSARQQGSSIC